MNEIITQNFGGAFCSLAYWLVWDESFLGICEASGVEYSQWPEELPRTIAETYTKLRETNGHLYAQQKVIVLVEKIRPQVWENFEREEDYVRAVNREAVLRYQAQKLSSALVRDPMKAQELTASFLEKQSDARTVKPLETWLTAWVEEFEKSHGRSRDPVVLPEFAKLSELIGGFNPGRVSIVLASTGFGKTNLGIQLSLSATHVTRVLYFNMEMIPADFTERLIVAKTGKPFGRITDLDAKQVRNALQAETLFVSDGSDQTVTQIRGLIRKHSQTHRIGFCCVDYDQKLQLTFEKGVAEWQALQRAMVALESIAKETNVHICVLAQTNDDGKISGSFRSLFPASTVLRFWNPNDHMTVIEAVKNRFGKRGAAIEVQYRPDVASVKELRQHDVVVQKGAFSL